MSGVLNAGRSVAMLPLQNADRFAIRSLYAEIRAPTTPPLRDGYGATDFRMETLFQVVAKCFSRRSPRSGRRRRKSISPKTAWRVAPCVQKQEY